MTAGELEQHVPRRRCTDKIENCDKRYLTYEKLLYIILGLVSGLLTAGIPLGISVGTYLANRRNFENSMMKDITTLRVEREMEIPKLDSVLIGNRRLENILTGRD
jgi:hypothetical protein